MSLWPDIPATVFLNRKAWSGKAGKWQAARKARKALGTGIIEGSRDGESEHRAATIQWARAQGIDRLLIPDTDEVLSPEPLAAPFEVAATERSDEVHVVMDTYWNSPKYVADPRCTTMMLGNGSTRKYQFDNRGQLTTQIEYSGATPLCTIVDGYDPVGNRVTRNLDGNPITWTYDDLYRLTGQQKAGQVCTYTLDGVGNLKTMWEGGNFPKTFTFNAADRLITMVEGASLTTYAWTGYGALESEITGNSTTGYAYNGQDQLAVVTEPSGDKTTYSFDGDGLRRSVATTNVSQDPPTLDVTTMVWDGSDYLLLNEP
ncbi:MAG: RHS repeat domain-containing protein, partial [Nitrospiraceae bacterium]